MISNEEKQRIREEEFFRHEVRRSFEKKTKSTLLAKSWSFLNSSFGLWLLSSVLVTFIVNSYTLHKEKVEMERKNFDVIQRMRIELQYRLNRFSGQSESILAVGKPNIEKLTILHDELDGKVGANVFPDLKERTFESILLELQQLEPDKQMRDSLQKAFWTIMYLKEDIKKYCDVIDKNPTDSLIKSPSTAPGFGLDEQLLTWINFGKTYPILKWILTLRRD